LDAIFSLEALGTIKVQILLLGWLFKITFGGWIGLTKWDGKLCLLQVMQPSFKNQMTSLQMWFTIRLWSTLKIDLASAMFDQRN
jgi:hypothetical protein